MNTTHLHTFTAGRFEVTVRVSVISIREAWTAETADPFDPAISEIRNTFADRELARMAAVDSEPVAVGPAAEARARLAEHREVISWGDSVSADDIRRAALRVTEINGGRGSTSARWAAMYDLLELWVKRYGDPPTWSETAEPGEGHDPIAIGQWFGNERGRRRKGKMTVAQRERLDQLLGEGWEAMRRAPYGVSKG